MLKELAGKLSPKVYEATSEQRKYLHIAAVFACNFANHMYALSARILEKHHIPFEVMWKHEVVDTFTHDHLKQVKRFDELLLLF